MLTQGHAALTRMASNDQSRSTASINYENVPHLQSEDPNLVDYPQRPSATKHSIGGLGRAPLGSGHLQQVHEQELAPHTRNQCSARQVQCYVGEEHGGDQGHKSMLDGDRGGIKLPKGSDGLVEDRPPVNVDQPSKFDHPCPPHTTASNTHSGAKILDDRFPGDFVQSRPPNLEYDPAFRVGCIQGRRESHPLLGQSRRPREALPQDPGQSGGDGYQEQHQYYVQPVSHPAMAKPLYQHGDKGLPREVFVGGADYRRPPQDGVGPGTTSKELYGQNGDKHRYQQPLRAGGNAVFSSPHLSNSQKPTASEVSNFHRAQDSSSRQKQMFKEPLRAGRDNGANQMGQERQSCQEIYQHTDEKPDQLCRKGFEVAEARKVYSNNEDMRDKKESDTLQNKYTPPQAEATSSNPPKSALSDVHPATSDLTSNELPNKEILNSVGENETSDDDDVKNVLEKSIDRHIENMVEDVKEQVNMDRENIKTKEHKPFDSNLVCPICNKKHRIGEIQKFKKHVDKCGNS